jgi:hypothetical protein
MPRVERSTIAQRAVRRAALLAALAAALVGSAAALAASPVGPAVAATFAPDGRLWRATPMTDGLYVDSSTDLGASFTAPVRVNGKRQRVQAMPEDRPAIAVDGRGRVYVVYAADARQPWTRYASFSADEGRSFAPPIPVSERAKEVIQFQPALRAQADTAQVLWMEEQGSPGNGALFVGALNPQDWHTPKRTTLHDAMCECCRLAVAAGQAGETFVLARLVLEGKVRDLGLVRIAASGEAAPVRRVTDDGWAINACPEHGPALAIGPNGRQHMAWFTLGAKRQGLFYAWSDDGGQTLSEPVAVGERRAMAGHADVAAAGRRVARVWQQFDGRTTSLEAQVSEDEGLTWSAPRELASAAGRADYPRALSDGRNLYVSWYAVDSGYHLIPLGS